MKNKDNKIIDVINLLIIKNKDKILVYLQNKIEMIRDNSIDLILNPLLLTKRFDIDLLECNNLDNKYKTFFKFDEELYPAIYYNGKLDMNELRFFVMEEIMYYFIIKYVMDYLLKEEYLECMKNKVFHEVSFEKIDEILLTEDFVEKVIRYFSFDVMIPKNVFSEFEDKNLSIRNLSIYFDVNEVIINYYLDKDNVRKRVKTRN